VWVDGKQGSVVWSGAGFLFGRFCGCSVFIVHISDGIRFLEDVFLSMLLLSIMFAVDGLVVQVWRWGRGARCSTMSAMAQCSRADMLLDAIIWD